VLSKSCCPCYFFVGGGEGIMVCYRKGGRGVWCSIAVRRERRGRGTVVWYSIAVCSLPSSLRSEDPPPKAQ
jgi:hypothetical protein